MCFNPAKSWQLGWYESQQIEWSPLTQGMLQGTMVGVNDFGVSSSDVIVVRIENGVKDLFIGYNRAKGINWGTRMSKNKITVVEQGSGFSVSTHLAQLSAGEEYVISQYLGTEFDLVISFTSVSSNLDQASFEVYLRQTNVASASVAAFALADTSNGTEFASIQTSDSPSLMPSTSDLIV